MSRIKTKKAVQRKPERVSLGELIKPVGLSRTKAQAELIELGYIEPSGAKKEQPGRKYSGSEEILTSDNAEYLFLTNSFVMRGATTNAEAIMRNGIECVPKNGSDQKQLDIILETNDLDLLSYDIALNCELYGKQFVETYADKDLQTVRFELLPTPEMDYLRDSSQNVLFDKKTGRPQGYVQKRNGQTIAEWKGKDALRISEFKFNTLGGCIEGIPSIQTALYPASEYGYIRNSIADSFIRSLPVAHVSVSDATPEDIIDVSASFEDKFTARTTYVTSDRFTLTNSSPKNDIDVFKFSEAPLSEIAACFHMPIEMLASTQYLKSDDFLDRRKEWLEHIKVKQKKIASVFAHQIFSILFEDPIVVRFNSPETVTTTELIESVGFAVQSNALTPEQAFEILVKNQVFGPYSNSLKYNQTSGTEGSATEAKPESEPQQVDEDVDKPTE